MNSTEFTKSFIFHTFSRHGFHHTDSSRGASINYLAMMLEGEAEFAAEQTVIHLLPGDILFIPRGCRYHSYWHEPETKWHSLGFEVFPNPDEKRYTLQKLPHDNETTRIITNLAKASVPTCEAVAALYTLLGRCLPSMKTEQISAKEALIDTASRFMAAMPDAPVSEIARLCKVSESGLYAAFRACGTTPAEVRRRSMTDAAVRLLTTTDLTVEDIAERTGFSSAAYFLRVLKLVTGRTSREIRRDARM